MSNVFHPVNIIDFVAYYNESNLSRIQEAQYNYNFKTLYLDVIKSSLGMYIIDLARNAIKENEANPEIYHFLKDSLICIDNDTIPVKHAAIRFTIDLAAYLGFQIQNNYSESQPYFNLESGNFTESNVIGAHFLDEGLSRDLSFYLSRNEKNNVSRENRNILLDKLMIFYKLHIDGFKDLKSLEVIRTILS